MQDMLDQIWHDSAAGPGARTACSNSLQISNLANTTVVSVDDLSPAVLSGLECDDAVPFLILRWLNAHLVEVRASFRQVSSCVYCGLPLFLHLSFVDRIHCVAHCSC